MTRFLQILHAVALLLLIAFLCAGLWEGYRLQPVLESETRAIHATTLEAGLTLKNIRESSAEWKAASQAQARQSTALLVESHETLASIRRLVESLDATTIPAITFAVSQQNQALLETQEKVRTNLDAMQQATIQLQQTLASANSVIGDPALKQSIENLQLATAQTDAAMTHLSATSDDIQQVADKFRDDFVKPKNRAWAYVKALLGLGSQSRILFVGAK